MKLLDFIYKLCFEARRIPNIGFICPDGNIYNLNHFQNIKYPAFCASQLQHSEEGDWRYYQFNLFYVDRLVSSHKNTQEIQSEAVDALSRIIRNITSYGIETRGSVLYDVFTEKFDSECAGAYATVTFGTMVDDVCPEWYDTPLYLIKWTSEAEMQPNDYYFTPEGDYYMLSDEYYKIIYQGHDEHTGYLVYTDTSPKDGAGEYGGTFAIRDASVTTLDLSQANSTDFKIDSLSYNPMKELTFNQTLIELGDLRGLPLKSLMLPKSIKRFSGYVFGNEYGSQWKLPTVGYEGTMAEFEAIEKSDDWSGGTSNFGSLQYIQCSDGIICLRDCTDTFPYFTGVTTGDTDVQCRTIPFEEKIPYEFGDEDYLYIMGWNLSRSTSDAPARVCLENGTGRLVARQTGDIRNSSISSNYGLRPWVTFRVHYFTPSDSSEGMYIELPYEGKWLSMNGVGQVITTTGQTTLFYYAEDGEGNTWLETGDHLALSVDNSGYLVGRRYGDGFALTWGQLKDLCSDPDYPYCTYDCGADCPSHCDDYCEDCASDCPSHCDDYCLSDEPEPPAQLNEYALYYPGIIASNVNELDGTHVLGMEYSAVTSGDTIYLLSGLTGVALFEIEENNGRITLHENTKGNVTVMDNNACLGWSDSAVTEFDLSSDNSISYDGREIDFMRTATDWVYLEAIGTEQHGEPTTIGQAKLYRVEYNYFTDPNRTITGNPAPNQVFYRTVGDVLCSDLAQPTLMYNSGGTQLSIVSNNYYGEYGVFTFDGDIYQAGVWSNNWIPVGNRSAECITEIILPVGVKKLYQPDGTTGGIDYVLKVFAIPYGVEEIRNTDLGDQTAPFVLVLPSSIKYVNIPFISSSTPVYYNGTVEQYAALSSHLIPVERVHCINGDYIVNQ